CGFLRAACPGRGPRVLAGRPGGRLAVPLDLGDRGRGARVCVPAFPDRAAALTAVAPGRVVRGRDVRTHCGDFLVNATRLWSDPFGAASQTGNPLVLAPVLILMPAALVVSVVALVVRFARSAGEERLQLKWFAAAALLVVTTFIAS